MSIVNRQKNSTFVASIFETLMLSYARMAELVDALVSGTSVSNSVQVRVLFRVRTTSQRFSTYRSGGGIGRHATLRG